MAIEHLLFGTMRFVAQRHPDLLDTLDGSVGANTRLILRTDAAPFRAFVDGPAASPPPTPPLPAGVRR